MARAARTRKSKTPTKVSIDLSKVSKGFEAGEEYPLKVVECTLEEGEKAPYFNLKFNGLDPEYSNAVLYHMASTSETSLWRLRPLLEALGIEIPDGAMEIGPEDFIGKTCMASTYLDKYEGGSRVRADEFWPIDGDDASVTGGADFDLDDLSDEEVEKLAEAMEVTGRNTSAKRKALGKLDLDEVAEAYAELDAGGGETEESDEFDLEELDDDQIKALAEALEVTGKTVSLMKKKLAKMDQEEVAEAFAELGDGDEKKSEGGKVSSDEVNEMNEDDLEDLIEQHDLEVELDKHRTLKKKRAAVLDALEEADLLED